MLCWKDIYAWNPQQPFINCCFNWMIPNLYIGNGWKSPFPSIFKWLALGFQVFTIYFHRNPPLENPPLLPAPGAMLGGQLPAPRRSRVVTAEVFFAGRYQRCEPLQVVGKTGIDLEDGMIFIGLRLMCWGV